MANKQSNVHLIHPTEAIHQSQIYHVMSWSNSAKSTWDACRYIILCSNNSIIGLHHYASLQVTSEEINQITIRTVDQGDDQSGEWVVQQGENVTATFGDIVRQKAAYAPLIARLLYGMPRRTKAMQYGHDNEPRAHDLYCKYLHKFLHHQESVERTGFHIDYKVHHCTYKCCAWFKYYL